MEVQKIYEKLNAKLQAECLRLGDKIPYIAEDGRYKEDMKVVNKAYWTNGFWAGMLWEMYHAENNELFRKTAEYTDNVIKITPNLFRWRENPRIFPPKHSRQKIFCLVKP